MPQERKNSLMEALEAGAVHFGEFRGQFQKLQAKNIFKHLLFWKILCEVRPGTSSPLAPLLLISEIHERNRGCG